MRSCRCRKRRRAARIATTMRRCLPHARPIQNRSCRCFGVLLRRAFPPHHRPPLSGLKFRNLPQFVGLLSQQRPVTDAAALLGVKPVTVSRWIKRMRQWILHLDPTGQWDAKVRLGMEIRPDIACPHCGVADHMHYRGFASDTGDRLCRCDACGRFCRLPDVLPDRGPGFVLEHRVVARPPSPRRKI